MDNRPSFTAFLVISTLLAVKRKSRWGHFIPDTAEALYSSFVEELQKDDAFLQLVGKVPDQIKMVLVDTILAKGASLHFALRKKNIELEARRLIDLGVTQIVNIGAGYDTLLLRLASEYLNVTCIEVDHPSTQLRKRDILLKKQINVPGNFLFASCDLAIQSLQENLYSLQDYNSAKPTLFISEGVSMYIDAEANKRSLREMHDSSSHAYVVITALEAFHSNPLSKRILACILKNRREAFQSRADRVSMKAMLEETGFICNRVLTYSEMQTELRPGRVLKKLQKEDGEHLYFAESQPT